MLQSIKKYSVVVLAAFTIIGCGGGSESTALGQLENNGKAVTIKSLQSLGETTNSENLSNTKLRNSVDSLSSAQSEGDSDGICQSGTMDFSTENNQQTVSFNANNCNDGYATINGSVRMEAYEDGEAGGLIEVLTDLTIQDEYFSLFAKKGSNLKINIDGQNMRFSASFETEINGETFSASHLSIVGTENDDSASFYIGSGEMILGEYYFQVDPSYDNSRTPITVGENGFVSGVIKLLDGAGHKIEFAVVSKDEIALKVDENGDGAFSANEILVENIQDALDFVENEAIETSGEAMISPQY